MTRPNISLHTVALFALCFTACCMPFNCNCGPSTVPPPDAGASTSSSSSFSCSPVYVQTDARGIDVFVPPRDSRPPLPPPEDTGPPPPPLFDPCFDDAPCVRTLGEGAFCLTEYATGACTLRCRYDGDCRGGHCYAGVCRPACRPGGLECDVFGAACGVPDDAVPAVHICRASCFTDDTTPPEMWWPGCMSPRVCDSWSGACTTEATAGAANGSPCVTGADCRSGRCWRDDGASNGPWAGRLDGYCYSLGRVGDLRDYVSGREMPRENCPAGSAITPWDIYQRDGDVGYCQATCIADSDCRPGYRCNHSPIPDVTTSNGYCTPIDCGDPAMPCPPGSECILHHTFVGTVAFGACLRVSEPDVTETDAESDATSE